MRTVFICVLLLAGALCAQEADTFLLYRVGGRTWTIKSMPGTAGDQNNAIQFMRYEVLEVHEDHAIYSRLRLDQNKKPPKGVEASVQRVPFKADMPPFKPLEGATNAGTETLKVGGVSIECDVYSITVGNATPSKYWIAKRYPGLVVREEAMNGVDELVEFDAFKEDEPPKKAKPDPRKKPPKEEPADAPPAGTYVPKKAWVVSIKGVGFKRYEIAKVEGEEADIKVTPLDESKKPPKGAKPETVRVKFGVAASPIYTGGDGVKDRVEKRKSPAGVLECTVYRAKIDGKDAHVWVSVKYPGLVVRVSVGENGKDGLTELVEFKE